MKRNPHTFVVVWDNLGLEYIGDITLDEQQRTWSALKGEKLKYTIPNLEHLKLRAQFNPQRHYEIYLVNAVDGITADDIRDMFEANPQMSADTIRRLGHCLYSDRAQQDKILIT
jgi:hypothetical protein